MSSSRNNLQMNRPTAKSIDELDLVTQLVVKEILKDFEVVYVYGSRFRGNWRYDSDFDIAVPLPNAFQRIIKEREYSNKLGVKIELSDIGYYKRNPSGGLKIERHE